MPLLQGLGTAVPGEPVPQAALRAKAEEVLAVLAPEMLERMSVFETVGIRQRHFVRPIDWYLESHGWAERAAVYAEEGVRLLEAAASRALAQAGLQPSDVDGVVFVSTTGLSTPSLDARLANRMGLRRDVQRVPVWGLGCAGGVAGWNLAADLARAHPRKRFLLLALETCSLAFNLQDMSVRAFVATCLFSDGAAAAVIAGDEANERPGVGGRAGGGPERGASLGRIRRGASHQWPDTERVMGWDVLDDGLRVVFSRSIPDIVARDFQPVVEAYLKHEAVAPDRLAFHPGGTKVLDAYATGLGVAPARLDVSRQVLRDFGNISSPTALFVLQRMLDDAPLAPGETALLAALGPGFTGELGLLEG